MSATYQGSMKMLEPIEGGYCKGGMACGSNASGETYRGIDRGQWPTWAGWKLIDAYKKKYVAIPYGTFIKSSALDLAVADFYTTKFWNGLGFTNLKNPILAAMQFAFCVHRMYDAVGVFNAVAKQLGAKVLSSTKITPDAALAIEKNVVYGYGLLRNAIINYYSKRYAADTAAKYIKNRVAVFPTMLAPGGQALNVTTAPSDDALKSAGLALTVLKLLF